MWICRGCQQENEDSLDSCIHCNEQQETNSKEEEIGHDATEYIPETENEEFSGSHAQPISEKGFFDSIIDLITGRNDQIPIPDKTGFLNKYGKVENKLSAFKDIPLPSKKPANMNNVASQSAAAANKVSGSPVTKDQERRSQSDYSISETMINNFNLLQCNECGHTYPDGGVFCMHCGNKLSKPAIQQVDDHVTISDEQLHCSNCYTRHGINDSFCMNCGNKLSPPAEAPAIKNQPVIEEYRCIKCNQVHDAGDVFCMNCGNKLL